MINIVVLSGRLTKEIELRKTPTDKSVARFTLAVKRRFNDETDFISCVAWGQNADYLNSYAKKGSFVEVSGNIQTGSYEQNGKKVYTTDVICDSVSLVGGKEKSESVEDQFSSTPSINIEPDELPFY